MHYWALQPTPQGCQLFVDGMPVGSPAEPPPSGWLQRQYGILMPLEYEEIRLFCMANPYAGCDEDCDPCWLERETVEDDLAEQAAAMAEIMEWWIATGQSGTNPPGEGSAFYRIAQAYDRAHGFTGAPTPNWTGRPGIDPVMYEPRTQCPTRENFLPYCDPCTQALCGDFILPNCPMFGPDHPDCQRPPRVQVDPRARVEAIRHGYDAGRRGY